MWRTSKPTPEWLWSIVYVPVGIFSGESDVADIGMLLVGIY
jgi:hypothetical protein